MTTDTLYIKSWHTPLSEVPDSRQGTARIKKYKYKSGHYHMEGIDGYATYRLSKPIWVTCLQRMDDGWKDWMVDDPLHWISMQRYVQDFQGGSLLCAGLGLGLMLHHAVNMPELTQIDVVEISHDVIELISPTLPNDGRINIINDDFYHFISRSPHYDNILWDLAVGERDKTRREIMIGKAICNVYMPQAKSLFFGYEASKLKDGQMPQVRL